MMNLKQFQEWFDAKFISLLEQKTAFFLQASDHVELKEILAYLPEFSRYGKRLRPYMAYVGYVTEDGEEDIFPLLAGLEFLHLFCLVHDDIIDNESYRHELQTLHKKISQLKQSREIGRSVAMLVGDLLMAWSVESVLEVQEAEPYTIDEASREFRALLSDVLHGQLLDVLLVTEDNPTKEIIVKSMYLKSAQYSFFRPLHIGMILAGADDSAKEFASEYATSLGMGFQLQDDINDLLSDVREGQQTLISWFMFNAALEKDRHDFELYFSKEWSEDEEVKLMGVLKSSGAMAYAEKTMEDYFLDAEDAIFNHDKNDDDVWQDIIDTIRQLP
jgi:geranylgeranyl diphosphate synthase type I